MTAQAYRSDMEAADVAEAYDVLAHDPVIGRGLTCRWPAGAAPRGFVLFCHGLGSSGLAYRDLALYWARHGYLVIQPTFADAIGKVAAREPALGLDPAGDLSDWTRIPAARSRMFEILHAPEYWLDRIRVAGHVMDRLNAMLEATCGSLARPLRGTIAGHSFGAYTAQLLAGVEIDVPGAGARLFRDARFDAAILLSAQGRDQQGLRDGSWDGMDGPVLNVTGTLDRGANGGDWRWKSEPFLLSPPGDKYLAVLENGDHYLGGFADNGLQPQVPAQQEAVRQLTLAFLDAHILGLQQARDWLMSVEATVAAAPLAFHRK